MSSWKPPAPRPFNMIAAESEAANWAALPTCPTCHTKVFTQGECSTCRYSRERAELVSKALRPIDEWYTEASAVACGEPLAALLQAVRDEAIEACALVLQFEAEYGCDEFAEELRALKLEAE